MQTYKAPLRDMRFVLHELHDSAALAQLDGFADVSPDLLDSILEEAAKLAEEVILPTNAPGDEIGCVLENGVVKITTAGNNRYPIRQMQFARFNGENWEMFGELLSD